jgi:ankyrin repeat protein
MYTPFQYGYERSLVTIRDKREFVISRDFLDTAIRDGYLVGVQWYLNRSSDVNYLKSDGSTPLMSAVLFQHVEIVDRLLSAGADVNTRNGRSINALMMASAGGNIELVKLLIEHGAKPNDFDEEGRTALMAAAMNCRKDVARLLIERGAKENVMDTNGRTVHWYACKDSEMNDILMRRHDPASPR